MTPPPRATRSGNGELSAQVPSRASSPCVRFEIHRSGNGPPLTEPHRHGQPNQQAAIPEGRCRPACGLCRTVESFVTLPQIVMAVCCNVKSRFLRLVANQRARFTMRFNGARAGTSAGIPPRSRRPAPEPARGKRLERPAGDQCRQRETSQGAHVEPAEVARGREDEVSGRRCVARGRRHLRPYIRRAGKVFRGSELRT